MWHCVVASQWRVRAQHRRLWCNFSIHSQFSVVEISKRWAKKIRKSENETKETTPEPKQKQEKWFYLTAVISDHLFIYFNFNQRNLINFLINKPYIDKSDAWPLTYPIWPIHICTGRIDFLAGSTQSHFFLACLLLTRMADNMANIHPEVVNQNTFVSI